MREVNEVNGPRSLSALKFQKYTYNQSAISTEDNRIPLMVSSLHSDTDHLGEMEPPFLWLYLMGRDINYCMPLGPIPGKNDLLLPLVLKGK